MLSARLQRSATMCSPTPADRPCRPLLVNFFSWFLIGLMVASVLPAWADTCSYTYSCGGSSQCASLMGGYSGTKSDSGPSVNMDMCERGRLASIPGGSGHCVCTSGNSSSASTGGAMISNTGNFKQDTLTNAVNLMIVSNTKNPIVSSFMQGAATGFISSMFANNAEAQRQQQLMAQAILLRQQEQERQRRIAEQQRLDAMFARLTSALKLEGVPFNLSLKGMNSSSPESLQLKGMGSSGPDDLKLKIADSTPTAYGLKGLPGIYVGGPAGGDSALSNSPGATANPNPTAATPNPNLVSGPGTGTTGSGIPGLPGIYLDGAQPSQAPQLAQAAQTLNGPERAAAQDLALQAAQQNPTLAAPSEDPKVQNFQQATQEYQQALAASTTANQDYQTAQTHVESDRSAIDVARAQLNAVVPSVEQQKAFNQMLAAAKTDEEASMLARQNFDSTAVHLSASRDRAAGALAQTVSPALNSAPASTQTVASLSPSTVDLTHASQPVAAPLLRPAALQGGRVFAPALAPAPVPVAAIMPPIDVDACLAAATHSSAPPATRPTVEQLRKQLDVAKESLARLLETHQRENEDRAEWSKEMKKSGIDIGYQAFDLTTKFVLGHYAENAKEEAEWAEKGFQRTQDALKTETSLGRQASLEAEIAGYQHEGAQATQAHELLEATERGTDQGGKLRDFRGLLNDNGGSYREDNPIAKAQKGGLMPALEGFKQTVKITLSDKGVQETLANWLRHAEYVPLIDRTVTIGSALIDTGYDLTVEYLGFYQLQQADQNSELFYRGAAPLQKKIQTTVGQLKCFQ